MATKTKGRTITHEIAVVGLQFRLKADLREMLARSCKLRPQEVVLVRQQENQYDANAIAVVMKEGSLAGKTLRKGDMPGQIGYVGAETAVVLAERIDRGDLVVERAQLLSLAAPDHKRGEMLVTLRDLS